MRLLVDESTGPAVAHWLRGRGHEVFSVYEQARGMDDDALVVMAFEQQMILITNDKDFGEEIYRQRRQHCGVVLLRLRDERAASKIRVLQSLLTHYADQLSGHFVVATESRVRFAAPFS
jgi:predicted nuclease of predicted toxin-antitoxin system